jgi:hypothetical protein
MRQGRTRRGVFRPSCVSVRLVTATTMRTTNVTFRVQRRCSLVRARNLALDSTGPGLRRLSLCNFPLIWSQAESPLRKEVGAGRHRGDHVRNRPVEPASGNFPESNTKSLHLLDISILFVWLLHAWRVCKFQANFTIWVLCEPSPRHAERGSTELQLESRKIVQGCMV